MNLPASRALKLSKVQSEERERANTPERFLLKRHDWVPNNSDLPVLHYREDLQQVGALAPDDAEALLGRNGWSARWRDGIFFYHHYHSTAHEVLAIFDGRARVTASVRRAENRRLWAKVMRLRDPNCPRSGVSAHTSATWG